MIIYVIFSFGVANAETWDIKAFRFRELNSEHWDLSKYEVFEASEGDYFLVDIDDAVGYLVNNSSNTYASFPIMTGAKRTPTPEKEWVVKEKNIQPNRTIFGETGEFLRMYTDEGGTRTGYGIHNYAFFEEEIENGTKYLSLGCILVSASVHDLIEKSYLASGENMKMITTNDVDLSSYVKLRLES